MTVGELDIFKLAQSVNEPVSVYVCGVLLSGLASNLGRILTSHPGIDSRSTMKRFLNEGINDERTKDDCSTARMPTETRSSS